MQKHLLLIGQGFARATPLLFTIAAAEASRQYLWFRFRARATLSLEAIDALVAIPQSLVQLFIDLQAWRMAWFGMTLALLLWLLQISSIFTLGTLTAGLVASIEMPDMTVPFPKLCDIPYGQYNITYSNASEYSLLVLEDPLCYVYFEPYNQRANTGLQRVSLATMYNGEIMHIMSPCGNRNCS